MRLYFTNYQIFYQRHATNTIKLINNQIKISIRVFYLVKKAENIYRWIFQNTSQVLLYTTNNNV